MYKTWILFFASLATVFFLGFQGINVIKYYYGLAIITSLLISISSYYLYKFVPDGKLKWYEFIAYCLGGAIGIVLSMLVHQYLI